jgi:hypothetical protein
MMNTEMKIEYTRAGLLDMLHAGYTTVTFTKADGSERVMVCTLRSDLLPDEPPAAAPKDPADAKIRKENLDVMRVFDTEKNGWRSFRIDSIKKVVSNE